jgi:hypothetical protein
MKAWLKWGLIILGLIIITIISWITELDYSYIFAPLFIILMVYAIILKTKSVKTYRYKGAWIGFFVGLIIVTPMIILSTLFKGDFGTNLSENFIEVLIILLFFSSIGFLIGRGMGKSKSKSSPQ